MNPRESNLPRLFFRRVTSKYLLEKMKVCVDFGGMVWYTLDTVKGNDGNP